MDLIFVEGVFLFKDGGCKRVYIWNLNFEVKMFLKVVGEVNSVK